MLPDRCVLEDAELAEQHALGRNTVLARPVAHLLEVGGDGRRAGFAGAIAVERLANREIEFPATRRIGHLPGDAAPCARAGACLPLASSSRLAGRAGGVR